MAWYRLTANENDQMTYNNIGCMHSAGLGACQDHHIAMEYFLKAASLGSAMSMSNIGKQFFHGRGVTVNLHYALAWYLKRGKRPDRLVELNRKEKSIYQMISETSNILRQERIRKEAKNSEPLCNQIRELQIQNQLVKKENALYKQKVELFERLLQAQQEEITGFNKRITRLEQHGEVDNRLESLEESTALIVNNCNTNDKQCDINGARPDTMKNIKIKEEPCEMPAKKKKKGKHDTTAFRR